MSISIRYCLLAGATLLPVAAWPAEPPKARAAPAAAPEARPYVLFMRTDVEVEQDKKLYPIKDVNGRMFIISMKGQPVALPMAGIPHRMGFQHALTLARASASVTGLKSERAYTPGNDPMMKRQREAVLAEATMGDAASLAEGKMIAGMNNHFVAVNADARGPDGSPVRGAAESAAAIAANGAADAASAFSAMNMAEELRSSALTSGAFARLEAESDKRKEMFDAVAVRFEVSSPYELAKPYVVVITRFHTPDDRPGQARNAVFAKALEPIGSRPVKVDLLHGGFPRGFEIEEVQMHLYNDGQELPTAYAQKRVPLSQADAFEYLKIDYFRGHKGETVLASPAIGRPDPVDLSRLGPKRLKATFYVKVDKDGRPHGVFADEDCTAPADEMVTRFAGGILFFPAFDQGKPVDGVARLVFARVDL